MLKLATKLNFPRAGTWSYNHSAQASRFRLTRLNESRPRVSPTYPGPPSEGQVTILSFLRWQTLGIFKRLWLSYHVVVYQLKFYRHPLSKTAQYLFLSLRIRTRGPALLLFDEKNNQNRHDISIFYQAFKSLGQATLNRHQLLLYYSSRRNLPGLETIRLFGELKTTSGRLKIVSEESSDPAWI